MPAPRHSLPLEASASPLTCAEVSFIDSRQPESGKGELRITFRTGKPTVGPSRKLSFFPNFASVYETHVRSKPVEKLVRSPK